MRREEADVQTVGRTGRRFQSGDWVVYRKSKHGPAPGPRARQISPATQGEDYGYVVDKFWVVAESLDDGRVRLRTRRGKEHLIPAVDPILRRARWWERWLHRSRFQDVERQLKLQP
jgi:hypothetical protein